MRSSFRRRVPAAIVGALLLAGILAVSSDAGHQSTVASYTGCLKPSQGALSRFAVGNSPSAACPVDQVQMHVGGGDVTAVTAGAGLTGGATQGAASLAVDTSAVQARVTGTCVVGSAIKAINSDGTVVCESFPSGGSQGELLLIQRDEFDAQEAFFNGDPGSAPPGTKPWEEVTTGTGTILLDPEFEPSYVSTSAVSLDMTTYGGSGSAVLYGNRQASVSDGTLVFTADVLDAYAESGTVYGDGQPRGLANGGDRNNAIEFVNGTTFNHSGFNTTAVCRTVDNGTATETVVDIGQWVRRPAVYQIIATLDEVRFYVNAELVCTHTTNIPTEPLNVYFGTANNGAGHIPLTVDWVSFEQRQS